MRKMAMKKESKRYYTLKPALAGICCAALVGGVLPLLPAQAVLVRTNEEYKNHTSLRPISETFHMDKILDWQPGVNADDALNKASIPLASRYQGHLINPKASAEGKIQMLSLMNSKDIMAGSTNDDIFDSYAFDYWQYLDSAIFWDGPVPTADMIDAAHRNGVPIYGTLFFNWSTSPEDNQVFKKFIKSEMRNGVKVFPAAEKLVEIALYYGFDGYFINQETTGSEINGKAADMRDFMLYAKSLSKARGKELRFSWYDAMTNSGNRDHQNAVNGNNDIYIKPTDAYGLQQTSATNEFFMNFNWNGHLNTGTAKHMEAIGKSPFDAYAGFELQQASYLTRIPFDGLVGTDDKLKVSIGLFTPDSIRGLSENPEDYHEKEKLFWVGQSGDPSKEITNREGWTGMSRFVGDKTAVTSLPFSTNFNTGHGKKWFVAGEEMKSTEWTSRGVSGIMPTWRWWIRPTSGEGETTLSARYDFDDAYNSGTSVKLTGRVSSGNPQDVMLYSTRLMIEGETKLKLAYKGGTEATGLILATKADYSEFTEIKLPRAEGNEWRLHEVSLAELAGQEVFAIGLRETGNTETYSLNLGQLSVYNSDREVEAPQAVKVDEQIVRNAGDAEARISWQRVDGADYYEVYETDGTKLKLINATSSDHFYASHITRRPDEKGTMEKLYVVAVGKNGERSNTSEVIFDWGMTADATEIPEAPSPNICYKAKIVDKSGENPSEPARNALNGTISGNTDKWCVAGAHSGFLEIDVREPKTVRRWYVAHAGRGGEGEIQNTVDFELQYFDEAEKQWKVAHHVKDNRENETDIILAQPITAQRFKLKINHSDRSAWTAIRIYEWQMFEKDDNSKTKHIPMQFVKTQHKGENLFDLSFSGGPAGAELKLATDIEMNNVIHTEKLDDKGAISLKGVEIPADSEYLYYTTRLENKEPSLVMSVRCLKIVDKPIRSVTMEAYPSKLKYMIGEKLDLKDGRLKVIYEDGETAVVSLDDPQVEIKGFDDELDEVQKVSIFYRGLPVDELDIEVFRYKEVSKLEILVEPKSEYQYGEGLSLRDGLLHVTYIDDTEENIAFNSEAVEVSGFVPTLAGKQNLSVSYKGKTIAWYVTVAAQIRYEKLEAAIRLAKEAKFADWYQGVAGEQKLAFEQKLLAAEAVLAELPLDQKAVDVACRELETATSALRGGGTTEFTPGWHQDETGRWYEYEQGKWYEGGWHQIDGVDYYFRLNGYVMTDAWVDNTYYVDAAGKKLRSAVTPDGIRVDADGLRAAGTWKKNIFGRWYEYSDGFYARSAWLQIEGRWYYFNFAGYLQTNRWIEGRYYVDHNGVRLTSTWTPDGYYVDETGSWVKSMGRRHR